MPERSQTATGCLILAIVLGLHACGQAPDGSPEGSAATPTAEVGTPVTEVVGAQDSAPTPSPPTDSVAGSEISTAPPGDADRQAAIDRRLESLVAAQETLTQRVDSLLARVPAAASGQNQGGSDQSTAVLGEARDRVQSFGVGVAWSIVVIVLFNLLIRALVWVLGALSERSAERRLFYKRLVPIVRIVLWLFAAYLIVRVIFRVDAQGFLAASAAVGVAVGFAAQDLLKNLFGGLILVFDQPFQVGDKISVGGTYGEVVSIGLRSTRIVTADDNLVSVPNAQVVDQQVANANAGELNCQVVTDLFLPGWVDESLALNIAFEAAASSKYVYLNKPIVTLVKDEFKETFLTRISREGLRARSPLRVSVSERRDGACAGGIPRGGSDASRTWSASFPRPVSGGRDARFPRWGRRSWRRLTPSWPPAPRISSRRRLRSRSRPPGSGSTSG